MGASAGERPVRILAVSDVEDPVLYDHFDPARWASVDLIISCGDLRAGYLDYLVSRLNVPLLYVRGNHDREYAVAPPDGCENIDGRLVTFRGLRIVGFEGSRWYGGQGVEYHDWQIRLKIWRLGWRLWLAGGVDLVVAHAPPLFCADPACRQGQANGHPHQCEDAPDRPHRGFAAFRDLILRFQPRYFLHGHTHLGYGRGKRIRQVGTTTVIDCYRHSLLEIVPVPANGRCGPRSPRLPAGAPAAMTAPPAESPDRSEPSR